MKEFCSLWGQSILALLLLGCPFLSHSNEKKVTSYKDFRGHAVRWGSNRMVHELNRAVAHLRLLHGDSFAPEMMDPNDLVSQLEQQRYLDAEVMVRLGHDPVEWHQSNLRSVSYPKALSQSYTLELSFPLRLLSRALLKEKDPYVKLFAMEKMGADLKERIPLRVLLKGVSAERDNFFLVQYVQLLKTPHFYKKIPKDASEKVPPVFHKHLKIMAQSASSRSEKANALFLNLLFSDYLPELQTRTLMYFLDGEYPLDFLFKVFKAYPSSYLESFIEPFEKGYGSQFKKLLLLFEEFSANTIILDSLFQALLRRKEAHFQFHQAAILALWARLTDIPFTGDDTDYRNWYKQRRASGK
ncbi:hypothetical protein HOF92_12145 [bacterium]|jgi:hypothetical protein|nr:hypothetical protein [bacterium]